VWLTKAGELLERICGHIDREIGYSFDHQGNRPSSSEFVNVLYAEYERSTNEILKLDDRER
jgi:hypothetical protein